MSDKESISMWLYQIVQEQWHPRLFRAQIWENQPWRWRYGKKIGSERNPERGDVVVFFYAKKDCADPGIYGWGVIDRYEPKDEWEDKPSIYFTPTAPTNHLKMDPWWDEEAIGEIRGEMTQATLFWVPLATIPKIREGVKKWLSVRT